MTPAQIILVKNSWKLFRRMDPQLVGEVFYGRLFQQTPSLRPMFKPDMNAQYKKIADMLSFVVSRLDRIELLTNDIRELALRHIQYGVRAAHYKLVGEALLWTLEKGLGKDWNDNVREAWITCYQLLANTMIEASAKKS